MVYGETFLRNFKFYAKTLTKLHDLTVPINSVADLGCLSRIPDPDYTHPGSRISDLSISKICLIVNNFEGEKNIMVILFWHEIDSC
jgi:hypothetical protein